MNAYIYCADIYCGPCGRAIRARLKDEGHAPADPRDEETYDSDEYPKGPYPDGGGESDCPQHCGDCRCALENPLTSEGVRYVIDALRAFTETGRGDPGVLDDWAADVRDYTPDEAQALILERYTEARAAAIR